MPGRASRTWSRFPASVTAAKTKQGSIRLMAAIRTRAPVRACRFVVGDSCRRPESSNVMPSARTFPVRRSRGAARGRSRSSGRRARGRGRGHPRSRRTERATLRSERGRQVAAIAFLETGLVARETDSNPSVTHVGQRSRCKGFPASCDGTLSTKRHRCKHSLVMYQKLCVALSSCSHRPCSVVSARSIPRGAQEDG